MRRSRHLSWEALRDVSNGRQLCGSGSLRHNVCHSSIECKLYIYSTIAVGCQCLQICILGTPYIYNHLQSFTCHYQESTSHCTLFGVLAHRRFHWLLPLSTCPYPVFHRLPSVSRADGINHPPQSPQCLMKVSRSP